MYFIILIHHFSKCREIVCDFIVCFLFRLFVQFMKEPFWPSFFFYFYCFTILLSLLWLFLLLLLLHLMSRINFFNIIGFQYYYSSFVLFLELTIMAVSLFGIEFLFLLLLVSCSPCPYSFSFYLSLSLSLSLFVSSQYYKSIPILSTFIVVCFSCHFYVLLCHYYHCMYAEKKEGRKERKKFLFSVSD